MNSTLWTLLPDLCSYFFAHLKPCSSCVRCWTLWYYISLRTPKKDRIWFQKGFYPKLKTPRLISLVLKQFSLKYRCFCPELALRRDAGRSDDECFRFEQNLLEGLASHRVGSMLPKFRSSRCLASSRAIFCISWSWAHSSTTAVQRIWVFECFLVSCEERFGAGSGYSKIRQTVHVK